MTWSLQLTLWALPPILALLLATRDVNFLWPRRREPGSRALLALATLVMPWAVLDLISAVSPSLEVKLLAARLEYVPSALAPVAWAWFTLLCAGEGGRRQLTRWPMVAVYALSLTVVGAALSSVSNGTLIRAASLVDVGSVKGLRISHGVGHWAAVVLRFATVLGGTWVVSRHLVRSRGARRRALFAGLAALVALAPALLQLLASPGGEWIDLSSAGFAVGGSLLTWGVVRPDILNLGPVDRELVLRELRDPIVVMDGRGRIVDVNRAAKDLGLEPYGDVPLALGTLWATGPAPEGLPPTRVVLHRGGEEAGTYEVTLTPLGEGTSRRSALLLRDVTLRERMRLALEQANADLEHLARTDPLTALANRRHFMETLEREVDRSQRYRRPLSLVLLDLDHFKKVNDTHGHAAGDDVLKAAAGVLHSVCRDVDLASRIGGEELALILPETDAAGARIVAERVRSRIQAGRHVSTAGEAFQVTASIGIATADANTVSGEALLQSADEALYQAKDGGRNRVVAAG